MVGTHAKLNLGKAPLPIPLPGFCPTGIQNDDPFWSQHGPTPDSFTSGSSLHNYRNPWSRHSAISSDISMKDRSRSTSDSHDEPMPDVIRPPSEANSRRSHPMSDYSHPQSLTSSRQLSWYSGEDPVTTKTAHLDYVEESVGIDEQESASLFSDLVAGLSPREFSTNSGISAPSNTRVNSAANTPPTKVTMAGELRAVSYAGMPRSVSIVTRDPPPSFDSRVTTSYSVNSGLDKPEPASRQSEIHEENCEENEDKAKKRPVGRPAGSVKSRKEGRSSEVALGLPDSKSQRRASAPSAGSLGKENGGGVDGERSGDAKRKRVSKVGALKVEAKEGVNNPDSSPTRKLSKLSPESTKNPNNEIEYVTYPPMSLVFGQSVFHSFDIIPSTGDANCDIAI